MKKALKISAIVIAALIILVIAALKLAPGFVKDYIVAVKDGNVLVCPISEEQMIKEYSAIHPDKTKKV